MMKDVLVTCPPMLGQIDLFMDYAAERGLKLHPAKVTQILSEEELKALLPDYDGWIIGDDPATRAVFAAGQGGRAPRRRGGKASRSTSPAARDYTSSVRLCLWICRP